MPILHRSRAALVFLWVCSAFLLTAPAALAAQVGPRLAHGDLVRITYRCDTGLDGIPTGSSRCRRDVGTVETVGEPLVAWVGSERTVIPRGAIASIERRTGRKRHMLLGAGLGFLGGALLGALAPCNLQESSQEGVCRSVSVVSAGTFGLLAGGIVGWSTTSDTWGHVTLDTPHVEISSPSGPVPRFSAGFSLALP